MKLAIVERLDELAAVSKRLTILLVSEDPSKPLPWDLLARAAVAVNNATTTITQHVEALEAAHQRDAGDGAP